MNIVTEHPNFIVIDDFLLPYIHSEIWKYCQADDYKIINRDKWSKVWRLDDGNPLYGSLVFSNSKVEEYLVRTKGYKPGEYRVCPNGDVVDNFLLQLFHAQDSLLKRSQSHKTELHTRSGKDKCRCRLPNFISTATDNYISEWKVKMKMNNKVAVIFGQKYAIQEPCLL